MMKYVIQNVVARLSGTVRTSANIEQGIIHRQDDMLQIALVNFGV